MKLLSIVLLYLILAGCSRYGNSERTGQIVKIASEGFINRTMEVEIIKGSLNSGSGSFGSKFDFTIRDKGLIAIAQKAFNEGKEITVFYHSEAFCPLSSETSLCIFADSIAVK